MKPKLSQHYQNREPSAIRQAQITFSKRPNKDQIKVINLAIGNVSLPMHPTLQERMQTLLGVDSPFNKGVNRYTPSVGFPESRNAFLNIISCEGVDTSNIECLVTDGGSQAMELMLLGVCGPSSKRPMLLLDPAYTNYIEFGKRFSISFVSVQRSIDENGEFEPLDLVGIEHTIKNHRPSSLLLIPADNPTGQFLNQEQLIFLAKICVRNQIWMVSDEAYRQLYYGSEGSSSIWKITENEVPGITGIRISIESASKVWNACGLRIGCLLTDNQEFHKKAVAEYTANLCANAIGQYIFGGLANESHDKLKLWYDSQRNYYRHLMENLRVGLLEKLPGLIITKPSAPIYMVIDFKNICPSSFNAKDFVTYCASEGKVKLSGKDYTLLLAPMNEFYSNKNSAVKTQMRIAMVEPQNLIEKTPTVLSELYYAYIG